VEDRRSGRGGSFVNALTLVVGGVAVAILLSELVEAMVYVFGGG
jgi:hypothetical protein